MKYLAVVPARGGSKRVPRKNVLTICGQPLLYWSILAGLQSKKINKVVVSTEDSTVKHFADLYGVETIDRPPGLAKDDVGLAPVIKHALDVIPADNVVVLRPTSPIRINNIIDEAIDEFEKSKADSLMTGFYNKEYEWFTKPDTDSQSLKGWFQGDGCVEIHKASVIQNGKSYGEKCNRYVVPEMYNHEIDTEIDFLLVEFLMGKLLIR